jgi:hypothetical protein
VPRCDTRYARGTLSYVKTNPNSKTPAKPQLVGTDVPTEFKDIGPYVKARYAEGATAVLAAQEALLDIGVALHKAKSILKTTRAYGEWFTNQRFPFSVRWGNELQRAGAVKAKVLKALKAQIAEGEPPNFQKALKVAEGKALRAPDRKSTSGQTPDDDAEPEADDDTGIPEAPPTEPLPKKAKPTKAAPVPVLAPGTDRPLTDEWVLALMLEFEENVVPWIEKGAADGVDEATANTLDALAGFLANMVVPLCGEIAANALAAGEDE